jgi:hypothetical protein
LGEGDRGWGPVSAQATRFRLYFLNLVQPRTTGARQSRHFSAKTRKGENAKWNT